jgi:hypothetical protein
VERLFQTLQDRMVKAMRLQGISGIESANGWLLDYLQEHNASLNNFRLTVPVRKMLPIDGGASAICRPFHPRTCGPDHGGLFQFFSDPAFDEWNILRAMLSNSHTQRVLDLVGQKGLLRASDLDAVDGPGSS